jgi:hypothetical protein
MARSYHLRGGLALVASLALVHAACAGCYSRLVPPPYPEHAEDHHAGHEYPCPLQATFALRTTAANPRKFRDPRHRPLKKRLKLAIDKGLKVLFMSQRQIAKGAGVHHMTLTRWLTEELGDLDKVESVILRLDRFYDAEMERRHALLNIIEREENIHHEELKRHGARDPKPIPAERAAERAKQRH